MTKFDKVMSYATEGGLRLHEDVLQFYAEAFSGITGISGKHKSEDQNFIDRYINKFSMGIVFWDDDFSTTLYKNLIDAADSLMHYSSPDPNVFSNTEFKFEGLAFIRKELMNMLRMLYGSEAIEKQEPIYFSIIGNTGADPLFWSKVILFHSNYFDNFFINNTKADIILPLSAIALSDPLEDLIIKEPENKIDSLMISEEKIKNVSFDKLWLKDYYFEKAKTQISNLSDNPLAN